MGEILQHLVLVRHGEGEGDIRRAAWKRGEAAVSLKRPEDEEITAVGIEQSHQAGLWIAKHILQQYGLKYFDGYFVSMSLRSVQSAVAMCFKDILWFGDERLDERNRGYVRGLKPEQHRELFPDSYEKMRSDPLRWVPPGGESILGVAERWRTFHEDISDLGNVIIVGHRDQIWASQQQLERLSDSELLAVNTDDFHNAQVIHYTSVSPQTGREAPALMWKRSVDPLQPEASSGWQILPNVAAEYDYAA
jgi:broad specificity phosphatase PhoE